MNHRWQDDTCTKCGVKRKRKTFKYLMATTNHPPYDHYIYKTGYLYSIGIVNTSIRPQCSKETI